MTLYKYLVSEQVNVLPGVTLTLIGHAPVNNIKTSTLSRLNWSKYVSVQTELKRSQLLGLNDKILYLLYAVAMQIQENKLMLNLSFIFFKFC